MIATAVNLAWLASQAGSRRRFARQLHAPEKTQDKILRTLLARNASSAFGRAHGFSSIRTATEFADRVPLATYEQLAPWIGRIRAGEPAVLTDAPVTHLIPTGGSSGARKLIPFTAPLQREFSAAIGPWVSDLYATHPRASLGPSYWSISPAGKIAAAETCAVPIGFDDDASYLGGAWRRLLAAAMAVPSALRTVDDMETFFLLTLVCLLRRRSLRLISVWHPSFLLLLLDALPRHWESLLTIIRTGRLPAAIDFPLTLRPLPARATELARIGPLRPEACWPDLAVISCWTHAHAALGAREIARRFPGVALQPKGLLATEAFVSIPFGGLHPLAVGSHYFEFIDEVGQVLPAAALRQGKIYEVVVTTGGGLWRYRLGDRVRVNAFAGRTPSLEFLGRAGLVSDLCGEKITGGFAAKVIQRLGARESVTFAMLAPESSGYALFWEGAEPPLAGELDRLLSENPQYAWCRRLGQLQAARVFHISAGAMATYARQSGQKLGDIKPPALSLTAGWAGRFAGRFTD